jgi:hypothetical protein
MRRAFVGLATVGLGIVATSLATATHAQSPSLIDAIGADLRRIAEMPLTPADAQRFSQQAKSASDAAAANSSESRPTLLPEQILPRVTRVGDDLRFGAHNVVSREGESVVDLIRGTARGSGAVREANLKSLRQLSDQGSPEAQTFLGFVAEYGLFGTSRDASAAQQFYAAAASSHYQPALYNVALAAAYGKATRPDISRAATLIVDAVRVSIDASARVCGLGAFLAYRSGDRQSAVAFAQNCTSPLAVLPLARWERRSLDPQTLEQLRRSTATGVDDGFQLIVTLAQQSTGADPAYLYCKYALLNRVRTGQSRTSSAEMLQQATSCVTRTSPSGQRLDDPTRHDMAARGVAGFVGPELAALDTMRRSNRFHFGWSVPYLPFTQGDVDLFEPLMRTQ